MENIVLIEDDSVEKKIKQTAKKLQKKYSTKRKVNEKILKVRPWWQKLLLGIFDAFLVLLILFASCLSVSVVIAKTNKTVPSFAGLSALTIASGSMVAAGFDIGDMIVTKSVDAHTLNVGDKIAFYVNSNDYNRFYTLKSKLVEEPSKTKTNLSFEGFFGVKPKPITDAAKAGCNLVFHEIVRIYETENGERWFKTKGASNSAEDAWITSEHLVLGVLNASGFARFLASILTAMTKNIFVLVIIILIPLFVLSALLIFSTIKSIALAKLELDVVEEKRKLTDEICVKNNVGFNMDKKSKLKVLAQAEPDEKLEYISLLWKDGSAPNSIKKYYIRQQQILKFNKKLLNLNRECEKMLSDGVSADKIAKHYMKQKEQIEKEREEAETRLKEMRKAYKEKQIASTEQNDFV